MASGNLHNQVVSNSQVIGSRVQAYDLQGAAQCVNAPAPPKDTVLDTLDKIESRLYESLTGAQVVDGILFGGPTATAACGEKKPVIHSVEDRLENISVTLMTLESILRVIYNRLGSR